MRSRSLAEEYSSVGAAGGELAHRLEDGGALDEDDNAAIFYTLLRAIDRFYAQYNRYPGVFESQVDGDIPKLKVNSYHIHAVLVPELKVNSCLIDAVLVPKQGKLMMHMYCTCILQDQFLAFLSQSPCHQTTALQGIVGWG